MNSRVRRIQRGRTGPPAPSNIKGSSHLRIAKITKGSVSSQRAAPVEPDGLTNRQQEVVDFDDQFRLEEQFVT